MSQFNPVAVPKSALQSASVRGDAIEPLISVYLPTFTLAARGVALELDRSGIPAATSGRAGTLGFEGLGANE